MQNYKAHLKIKMVNNESFDIVINLRLEQPPTIQDVVKEIFKSPMLLVAENFVVNTQYIMQIALVEYKGE